jgi:chaperonin GroEL
VFAAVRGNWPWLTTETAIVEKPAEQADDHGHGHHHGHTH